MLLLLLPLTGLATASQERLAQARDTFDELWHSATETTKHRADLEQNLQDFDKKVEQAKQDLETAVKNRKNIRGKIMSQQNLVNLLEQQIAIAGEAEAFYRTVAVSQRDDYVSFIRYITGKEIAFNEAGPVFGGPVLRRMLRGSSLGDSVDEELAHDALLKARGRFLEQVGALVDESNQAEDRLKNIAGQYTAELGVLEKQSKILGSVADKNAAFIDDSWRQRKLTEEELKTVAQEADEAQSRVSSMQTSLIQINTQLKEERLKELKSQLDELEKQKKDFSDQRDALLRKSEALKILNETAMRALQTAMQQKNTDKKLYKKIDELKLSIGLKENELKALAGDGTGSGTITGSADKIKALTDEINYLKEKLDLMNQGVPADAAGEVVRTRHQAEGIPAQTAEISSAVEKIMADISALNSSIGSKLGEIETTRQQTGMEGLPIFSWPVRGPITATYLDPDYQRVFGIPHRAVDIAVAQGSPVHALAEGIVFAVKDGGKTGYSYILIGHRNGYASLYGHVSLAMVKTGDVVRFGQTIALSGGQPGTHGAGHMTTGPHLHLEIMKDGEHVNPLSVLPK